LPLFFNGQWSAAAEDTKTADNLQQEKFSRDSRVSPPARWRRSGFDDPRARPLACCAGKP
jgi:hypothetical protein